MMSQLLGALSCWFVPAQKGQSKGSSSSSLLGEGCSAHLLRKTTKKGGLTPSQCQTACDDSREKKKNLTSLLPRFISLCLTSTSRCSSSQWLYWILGHPGNCCKWEMIPQHLACVHPDPERLSIHLGRAQTAPVLSEAAWQL